MAVEEVGIDEKVNLFLPKSLQCELPSKEIITLTQCVETDHLIRYCSEDKKRSVLFSITNFDRGLILHINKNSIQNLSESNLIWAGKIKEDIARVCLDSYSIVRKTGEVNWDTTVFDVEDVSTKVAVFKKHSESEDDKILLKLWVEESSFKPGAVSGWNIEIAKKWLHAWQTKFKSRNQFFAEAEKLEELYELVDVAVASGADEFYLFTNTWRPDSFWPMTAENWALNTKVFPNGRKDLRALADHVHSKGLRIALHWVSGGIGLLDESLIGQNPHKDLASWAEAVLLKEISEEETNIEIEKPFRDNIKHLVPSFFEMKHIQIDSEIIEFESYEEKEDCLVLKNCKRQQLRTKPSLHLKGVKVKMLLNAYGQNFIPNNQSSLFDKMAKEYASLLNDCAIDHVEFDGGEIHCYNGRYGYQKFSQRINENLDHPVSSHDSSGFASPCFFEYQFESTKQLLRGACPFTHGSWLAPVLNSSLTRSATTVMDAHFFLSHGHYGGAFGLGRPEPMFGVPLKELNKHGLISKYSEILKSWKAVSEKLTEEQHVILENSFVKTNNSMPQASHHRKSDGVWKAKKSEGGYCLSRCEFLTDEDSIAWQLGQEFGPLSPSQFIENGQSVNLKSQQGIIQGWLRVLPAFKFINEVRVAKTEGEDNSYGLEDFFVEGNHEGFGEVSKEEKNIKLLPDTLSFDKKITAGYQLQDEFEFSLAENLSNHRGLLIRVEGDGSGSLIRIELSGMGARDYIVKLDFTGSKEVFIPSGEVAWSRKDWGWRMGTKTMNYSMVTKMKVGLAFVPEGKLCTSKIIDIIAVKEDWSSQKSLELQFGSVKLNFDKEVNVGDHLCIEADLLKHYDKNWQFISEQKVKEVEFDKAQQIEFSCANKENSTNWYQSQWYVETKEIKLP